MNGDSQGAAKSTRFFAGAIDLIFFPLLLGVIFGIAFAALRVPPNIRPFLLMGTNIGWLFFRDLIFSPGRHYTWRKISSVIWIIICIGGLILGIQGQPIIAVAAIIAVIFPVLILIFDKAGPGQDLKLTSVTGVPVSFVQVLIRNLSIMIPFALATGYFCETARIFLPKVMLKSCRSPLKVSLNTPAHSGAQTPYHQHQE